MRPICQVEAGQRVWAYDFQAGEWKLCEVECRHDSEYDGPLVTIDVGIGEVRATAFHPFWVTEGQELENRPALRHVDVNEDRGESLPGRWVNSHDLQEGDVVFLRGRGPLTIRRVMEHHEHTPVCNLTIQGLHTFAVGEMQVLVHNTSGTGGVGNGANTTDDILVRRGTSRESAQRLAKQAEAAENAGNAQNGVPYGHGVSVTTPESNALLAKDPLDAVAAQRRALEDAGFEVRHTPTRADPNHHTIQLPKPVTEDIADIFNQIFGRKPKGGGS